MEQPKIDRRNFLKLGLIGLLPLTIAGCRNPESEHMKMHGYDRVDKNSIKLPNALTCEVAHRDKNGEIDTIYIHNSGARLVEDQCRKEYLVPGTYKRGDNYFDELKNMLVENQSQKMND